MKTDVELISNYLSSEGLDQRPLVELMSRYNGLVFSSCLRYLRNKELADEVTQDVFFKVYEKIETLKNHESFKSWILQIAYNCCAVKYKKVKRKIEIERKVREQLRTKFAHENKISSIDERIQVLHKSIAELYPTDQSVVRMHYFSEMSVSDISKELELSVSAVKMRLLRARERIQKNMVKSDEK